MGNDKSSDGKLDPRRVRTFPRENRAPANVGGESWRWNPENQGGSGQKADMKDYNVQPSEYVNEKGERIMEIRKKGGS
jgi:hypothetical protein